MGLADGGVEHSPHYGYRRLWALRAPAGIPASPRTVYRWMKRPQPLQQTPRGQCFGYRPLPGPSRSLPLGLDFTR